MRQVLEEKRQQREREKEREAAKGKREEPSVPRKQWAEPGQGDMPVIAQQYDATGFISEGGCGLEH